MNNKRAANTNNKKALLLSNVFFPKFILLLIVLFILLFFLLLWNRPQHLLVITDMNTGETLWTSEIEQGETFFHEYIHSVEKSPVKEVFQFSASAELVTMESWTKSFGAGMPYQREGDVELKDGYYVMKNINRPVHGGTLRMKPSDLYPHIFSFHDETIYLSKEPFVKKIIEIKVRKPTWWEGMLRSFSR
ncbi:DUF1850 domain-containing protein [Gracilibacillus sp. S3-1-1]|uniref:DUF1850 domain-containing protein n=1 Tax=Gracilibacillus pellucidus TaxID=3095368 RepID=A0ACC6M8K7_9BACI|nr:DUF1850 domain-containing protein [Gracilibacillus sp. S3-1-1]MDX8047320.1 DUF1850 domain-containing protein [Gracilibacillus sp. S3-1-1]